jgi:hypothetical protein
VHEQRRPQRTPEPGQRRQLLLRLGAGFGVPLPDVLLHHLLEQSRLAFGEVLVHAEVPGADPVCVEAGGRGRDRLTFVVEQRVAAVVRDRLEQAERLELVQLPVLEAGGTREPAPREALLAARRASIVGRCGRRFVCRRRACLLRSARRARLVDLRCRARLLASFLRSFLRSLLLTR